ncbi:MAG: hypothetical protein ABI813_01855 [Bacteroidota bacterium]
MNIILISNLNRKMLLGLLMIAASLLFQSCGTTKMVFANSSVVPAAEGSVKVKKDKNNNYDIDLNVMRLADPKRLSPPAKVYVVWMETERNGTKNIGQITSKDGLFSSTLRSSLHTKTPFKPTEIFITAEEEADRQYPGSMVVLRTNSF